jgi:hypothetical protein
MKKYVLKVETKCKDPQREDEFQDWYDNIHIPDVLETKGFIKAERYELFDAGNNCGRYMALYEIETDDYGALMAAHGANMKAKEAQGRLTDLIEVVSRGIFKKPGA